jgi:hypothetical protein
MNMPICAPSRHAGSGLKETASGRLKGAAERARLRGVNKTRFGALSNSYAPLP